MIDSSVWGDLKIMIGTLYQIMRNHVKYSTICSYLKDRKFKLSKAIQIESELLTNRFEYWSNEEEEVYLLEVLTTEDAFVFKLI